MWEYFQTGGYLMAPLLACSVISLSVIIERIVFWFRCPGITDLSALTTLLSTHSSQQLTESEKVDVKLNSHEKNIAASISKDRSNVAKSFRLKATCEIEEMNRGMMILSTIITLAPLLGILGTVVGIIDSFHAIGASSKADPQLVSKGIAQALTTTAAGLSVAIVTLIPFNYFQTRINRYCDAVDNIVRTLDN